MIGWGGGRYDVFLLNIDSKLFHYLYDGSWSDLLILVVYLLKLLKRFLGQRTGWMFLLPGPMGRCTTSGALVTVHRFRASMSVLEVLALRRLGDG